MPPDQGAAERWRRIDDLYHAARDVPRDRRAAWLRAACDDESLCREVESLVRYDDSASDLLDRSALEVVAESLARDPERALIGRRLGGYEIVAWIGSGGMGDVYRARDHRLQRDVALKVFEHASSLVSIARVEEEARAASVLNHPNIVTIYGVGDDAAEDVAFIAMELVEGRSLRARLEDGPLPDEHAFDLIEQLARAMAFAHARGIVHRDLKPENVVVTDDWRVKVLDFGIAARSSPAWDASVRAARRDSVSGGTVGYMAPEADRGAVSTAATDQFAFGIVCHEILTGRRPVARSSEERGTSGSAAAVTIDAPRGEIQRALWAVIARCLAAEPTGRFPDSAALVSAIADARGSASEGLAGRRPARRAVLVTGALALAGAAAGVIAWRRGAQRVVGSVALMPFANPVGDPQIDYLCDGITETLIRQLARVPSLMVAARATVFQFRGTHDDPRAIGQRLGMESVLVGSIERRAGRLRTSAELIETRTGARLWGADYDRAAVDVLAVQNDIAEALLANATGLDVDAALRRRLSASVTDDPAAYDAFLEGVHHLRASTESDYLDARARLLDAVTRRPTFALAQATLASTYSAMAVDGYESPAVAWPRAEQIVGRALDIDPDLPDAHAEAAASAFFYRWRWDEAERRWQAALRLRSELQSELLLSFALHRWALGRAEAALELARAARRVDPLHTGAAIREADLLAATGRLDSAAEAYGAVARDAASDVARAQFGLAYVRARQTRYDDAIVARQRAYTAIGDDALATRCEGARGERGYRDIVRVSAEADLARLDEREAAGDYVSPFDRARDCAQVGDVDRAFAWLMRALDERSPGVVLLQVDPVWAGLRDDPRYGAAIARVGLRS